MKQNVQSVYDILANYADGNAAMSAAVGTDVDVNFAQLIQDVDDVSRYILAQGLKEDALVAVLMEPNYLHTVFILALDRLGMASLSYTFPPETLMQQQWWLDTDVQYIFSSKEAPANHKGQWVRVNDFPRVKGDCVLPVDRKQDRIVRLMCSSGTTGIPKPIALTRENVMHRARNLLYFSPEEGKDSCFVGMPYDTAGGYNMMLSVLMYGCHLVLWGHDENFLKVMLNHKPSHMLLTPLTLRNIAVYGAEHNIRLGFVKLCLSGGMIFDARLQDPIRAVFGNSVVNGYGSSEAWGVAGGFVHEHNYTPYMIGALCDGTQVQIVDEDHIELPRGEIGIVRIKTEFTIDGYFDGKNEDYFRDGYFYPGDVGKLDEQNCLSVLGRADNVINIDGQKILPEPIEEELTNLPEIEDAVLFQAPTKKGFRVCAAVVLSGDESQHSPDYHNAMIEKIKGHLGRLCPQRIFFVSALPRNAMGKVVRRELAHSLVTA